jgi:gamma-glutamyltranspeptidase/glutathione hydrolase
MSGFRQSSGERYAVASGCRYAGAVAADVMAQGGNCVDAAVAGSAVLCVTLPHAVSIGGDLFALVKRAESPDITAVNATDAAPARASTQSYRERGLAAVPVRGSLSIQPPPEIGSGALGALRDAGYRTQATERADIGSAEWGEPCGDGLVSAVCDTRREGATAAG